MAPVRSRVSIRPRIPTPRDSGDFPWASMENWWRARRKPRRAAAAGNRAVIVPRLRKRLALVAGIRNGAIRTAAAASPVVRVKNAHAATIPVQSQSMDRSGSSIALSDQREHEGNQRGEQHVARGRGRQAEEMSAEQAQAIRVPQAAAVPANRLNVNTLAIRKIAAESPEIHRPALSHPPVRARPNATAKG